jgi:hypothetical protein
MPATAQRAFILALFVSLFVMGCTKKENVYVPDNEAPPDTSVSTLKLEAYINKCYISLLGRKPDDTELSTAVQTLRDSSLNSSSRKLILNGILNQDEFLTKTYLNDGALLLNTWDTALYSFYLGQVQSLRQDPNNVANYAIYDTVIGGLEKLLAIPVDLLNGSIDISTMHNRMVNNFIYDEINMGSENYVRSVFDHFLLRYPTTSELTEGVKMVDGFESVIFLNSGESKFDFNNIFFNTDAYYEGQVRWAFNRFLYRDAATQELAYYTNLYRQTGNQKIFFRELLSTNEYAGF